MDPDHLLLAELEPDQQHLIDIIARPWAVNELADQQGWPVWDFVRRRFAVNHPDGPPAEEVLGTLPVLTSPEPFPNGSCTYGLWWRTNPRAGAVRPDERVGLSIAGLHHFDQRQEGGQRTRDLLGICLDIIAEAALKERLLNEDLDWTKVAVGSFDLREQKLSALGAPVGIVGQVLVHEFVPLACATTQHNYKIDYGNGTFARFEGVQTVADYLAAADALATAGVSNDLPRSPLALPAALDYLGLAVTVHQRWQAQQPLVNLPGFESAASICQPPNGKAEFEQRVSELWNIIGRLRVPGGTDEDYQQHGWDPTQKGSLNNLVIWLENALDPEEYESTCQEAIDVLRALGHVRQASQHDNSETRRRRGKAFSRLGLPQIITDWPLAWSQLLEQSAAAVHALTTAIRRNDH